MLDLVIFDLAALVAAEAPNEPVIAVFYDHFVSSRDVWIAANRSEAEREQTEDWLYANGVYYGKLLMRPADDTRGVVDLKMRWLHDGTIPRERVLCAYDREAPVADMYRAEGIQCFLVL